MKRDRLVELMSSFPTKRIAIIGDLCLDGYWKLDLSIEELSVETGKPIQHYVGRAYSPGGASNVAWNLADIGAKGYAAGVIGDDEFGKILLGKFQGYGINTETVLATSERITPTYIKVVDAETGEELQRMDMVSNGGRVEQVPDHLADRLLDMFREKITGGIFDAVIVNDQLKYGLSSPHYIRKITELISDSSIPFIVDTRDHTREYAVKGMIMKLNSFEALTLVRKHNYEPLDEIPQEEVIECLPDIYQRTQRTVLITRGEEGIIVYDGHQQPILVPSVEVKGETDSVGAGDTVISAIASAIVSGATYE